MNILNFLNTVEIFVVWDLKRSKTDFSILIIKWEKINCTILNLQ